MKVASLMMTIDEKIALLEEVIEETRAQNKRVFVSVESALDMLYMWRDDERDGPSDGIIQYIVDSQRNANEGKFI
jgi:hypothetical protein